MTVDTHTRAGTPSLLGAFSTDHEVLALAERRSRGASGAGDPSQPRLFTGKSGLGAVAVIASGGRSTRVPGARHPDGSFVVVDGEFYWDSPVANDAEAVLELYRRGGPSALASLSGAATLTLWDAPRQRLLLTRDPDGLAPCFYTQQGETLYWSSDLLTLLPYVDDRAVDLTALELLLASGFIASPHSMVRGIRRLPTGQVLVAEDPGAPRLERGLRYTGQPKRRMSREERASAFGARLEESIRRRYDGRPSGVLLSGGVDSTLLLGLLVRVAGSPVPGYTFHYEDYEGWKNEGPEARKAAQHFGVPHHEISIGQLEIADRLPEMVEQYGEPFAFGVHSFKLDRLVHDGVEVVFSGQGSGWYARRKERLAIRYARLPPAIRRLVRMAPPALGRLRPQLASRLADVMREASLPERAYPEDIASADVRAALVSAPGAEDRRRAALRLHARSLVDYRGESMFDQLLLAHQQLHSVDHHQFWNYRWARAFDLAMRNPYRDYDLMDFMSHMHRPEYDKRHQRRFAESLMPPELAYAPKLHQHAPLIEWLRGGPLFEFVRDELNETRLRDSGLFEPREVHRLLEAHRTGEADGRNHAWAIWSVLTTVLWQERVLRAAPVATPAL